MNNGRIQIPGMPDVQMPAMPEVQIAAPFNDMQLVAFLAAHRHDVAPAEAVAWALEITAEAIVQGHKLGGMIAARKRAMTE